MLPVGTQSMLADGDLQESIVSRCRFSGRRGQVSMMTYWAVLAKGRKVLPVGTQSMLTDGGFQVSFGADDGVPVGEDG